MATSWSFYISPPLVFAKWGDSEFADSLPELLEYRACPLGAADESAPETTAWLSPAISGVMRKASSWSMRRPTPRR